MADNENLLKTATMPETDSKCPNCGGTLTYDPNERKMYCSFCGKNKSITDNPFRNYKIESIDYDPNLEQSTGHWCDRSKLLLCANCGAELIYGATQISGDCPFCGSTNITPAAESGKVMEPNGLIPFAIDEKTARQRFSDFMNNNGFTPRALRRCTLDRISPVYLPFWVFEAYTVSHYAIDIGFYDKDDSRTYYRTCKGYFRRRFTDIPVCASSKVNNSQVDKLKQFHFYSAVPYNPEYLAGYYAERYSTKIDSGWDSARRAIYDELNTLIPKDEMAYQKNNVTWKNLNFNTEYSDIKFSYMMLPVYLASFTYKDCKYDVAINGKSGEVACDPPSNIGLRRLRFVLLLVAIAVIIFLLVWKLLLKN